MHNTDTLSSPALFLHDECGATAIEYALIAVLVALVLIAGFNALGTSMLSMYSYVSSTVVGASG